MSSRPLAALALLGVVLGAGCTVPESSPSSRSGPVTVAVLVDSMDDAAGADVVRGANLAIELVNGSYPEVGLVLATTAGLPGLGGAELRLTVGESGTDPEAAEAATDRLLADGPVAGVVAAIDADVVAVAAAYATRRGVPTVDVATSEGFLLDLGLEWYFRAGPTDRMLAEAAFALLSAEPPRGGGRAVVLTAAAEAPVSATEAPGLARAAGLTVVDAIAVGGRADVEAGLRLAEAAPDVAVVVAETAAAAGLLRETLSGLETAPSVVVELGAGHRGQAGGLLWAVRPAGWSGELAARHPIAAAVSGLYEERFGSPMTGEAAAGFTGVMTLAAAVDAAGSGDAAAVRVALRRLEVPATQLVMPWRGVWFRADGQNELAAAVVQQRTEQGWQVVFPPELAAGPVAWPDPPEGEAGR